MFSNKDKLRNLICQVSYVFFLESFFFFLFLHFIFLVYLLDIIVIANYNVVSVVVSVFFGKGVFIGLIIIKLHYVALCLLWSKGNSGTKGNVSSNCMKEFV